MEKPALAWRFLMINKICASHKLEKWRQLIVYALVGLTTNLAGYSIYIVITMFGGTPKMTMTILYFVGVVVGFFANRRITFKHKEGIGGAGFRYSISHLLGYTLNLFILYIFVDSFDFPHQYVQAIAIFIVAGLLFFSFRYFVFRSSQ